MVVTAGLQWLVVGVWALIRGTGLVGRALSELIEHRRGADFVPFYLAALLLIGLGIAAIRGLIAVAPGEARVLQLFGSYAGTIRRSGLRWGNPLSLRLTASPPIPNPTTPLPTRNDPKR